MTTKLILPILVIINSFKLQDCDCDMLFKKLSPKDSGLIVTISAKLPRVSWFKTGTIVQDSAGPYGDMFMDLIISDKDKIVCSRIAKGDSTLLPKVNNFLSKQTVVSAEMYGRKVYSLFPIKIQFIKTLKDRK